LKVLVAIPIFNEAKYVVPVLRDIRKYARVASIGDVSIETRVLVVDDGSTDRSPEVLRDLARRGHIDLLTHPENRGYGQSLIDAFGFAADHGYEWVITMDADEQHEPYRIPLFVQEIKKNDADIISGSRYLSTDAEGAPPMDRRSINLLITELLNTTLKLTFADGTTEITDAFCGYKAHRVSAMQKLNLTIPGYAFPMQFWAQAAANRLRIREISVKLIYKDQTRHFGGLLDDPTARLLHYLTVLKDELFAIQNI